jgi:hypothetical protein
MVMFIQTFSHMFILTFTQLWAIVYIYIVNYSLLLYALVYYVYIDMV